VTPIEGAPIGDLDSVAATGSAGATRPAPLGLQPRLQPAHGISLALYAQVSKRLSSRGYDPAAVDDIAVELGIPLERWQHARSEWDRRLASDPDVAAEFDRCYRSA
jgi:hypothetical protein